MASPSELSLEYKPQSYSMLLKSFGEQHDQCQTQKLEEFLARLEEERLKIDAFKRELPLCMQLLTNAEEASRQQLQAYRSANQGPRPILEEFIPLKHSAAEDLKPATMSDKVNWMTSAQLWSQAGDGNKQQTTMAPPPAKDTDIGFNVTSPKLGLDSKQRNGGAFLPFTKERNMSSPPTATCPNTTLRALPELALASNDKDMEDKKYSENENSNSNNSGVMSCNRRDSNGSVKIGCNGGLLSEQTKVVVNTTDHQGQNTANNGANTNGSNITQNHRKARRCWSPDLHRRFVNALQMLGGSQVATPKQIRELMKVDGLTNDEVKSHLQKYRLHTRRPSPSPQAPGAPTPQLVVLGSIWVQPDYSTAAAAAAAHSGAPAAALYGPHPTAHPSSHYCAPPPVPQEYYAAAATPSPTPAQHEIHHSLHHPLHVYKTTAASQGQSSPESGLRGAGGDRSESIEDGKSESNSWKGDSSENNGGERKGLTAMREDNEESNGGEITLKF